MFGWRPVLVDDRKTRQPLSSSSSACLRWLSHTSEQFSIPVRQYSTLWAYPVATSPDTASLHSSMMQTGWFLCQHCKLLVWLYAAAGQHLYPPHKPKNTTLLRCMLP